MSQIAANEITLHYESAGQGQPLLFITGVGYGAWFWHKLTPDLSHHFQVITFDNRGVGQSSRVDGPYSTAVFSHNTETVPRLYPRVRPKARYERSLELIRRGIAVACAPGFAGTHPDVVAELLAYRLSGPIAPAHYQAQVMAGAQHNAEARLGQITRPVNVLFGEHDKVAPGTPSERFTAPTISTITTLSTS